MEAKILLIDDDVRILQTFARTLKLAGYAVTTAEGGEEGMTLYHREQPDIVLLDLRMPGMSGLEVLQAMREHDPEANVILVTGHGDKDDVIEALRAGASDFLSKPIDQVPLESALRRAEERIHLKRELRASQEALRRHKEQLEEEVKARTAELEREIEEHRRTEEALRRSQESYHSFISTSREAIYCTEFDQPIDTSLPVEEQIDAIYQHAYLGTCNQAMVDMYGLPSIDAFIGQRLVDFHGGKDNPVNRATFRALIESGYRTVDCETEEVTPDGERRHFLTSDIGIIEDGYLVRIWGTATDITEQKRAEDKLRFQAHLLDAVEQAIIVTDSEGRVVYWNPFAEQLYGWSAEEVLGRTTMALIATEQSQQYAAEIMACLQRGESWSGEYLCRHRDDTTFPIAVTCTPISDAQGKVTHIIGISVDVAERKRMEEVLRESVEKYRVLFDAFPLGITVADREGKILEANRVSERLLGISLEEHTERDIDGEEWHIVRPDGSPMPAEEYASVRALQENRLVSDVEMGIVKPDGAITWINVTAVPLMDDRVVIAYSDITERKKAEIALRESEKRYRVVSELVSDYAYAFRVEPDGTMVGEWVTEAFRRITGYKPDELLTGESWANLFYPEDLPVINRHMTTLLDGQACESDYRIITKDGDVHWLHTHDRPEWDEEEGRVTRVYGAVQDITEQKQAEAALRESLTDLKLAQDIAAIGHWQFDPAVGVPVWSEEVYRIYARDPQLGPPHIDEYKKMYEPDQFAIFNTAIQRAIREGQPYDITLKLTLPDGVVKWIHAICQPDEHKGPAGYFLRGTIQDITERKRMEEALKTERDRAQQYLDIAGTLIVALDEAGQVTLINRRGCEVLGYERQDVIGQDWFDTFLPGRAVDTVRNIFDTLISGDEDSFKEVESHVLTKTGEERLILWHNVILRSDTDCVVGTLSSGSDITERKRVEEDLRTSEALLNATGQMANVGGWEVDVETSEVRWSEQTRRIHQVPMDYQPSVDEALAFFPPGDREKLTDAFQAAIEQGTPYDMELRFVTDQGEQLWARTICQPQVVDGKTLKLTGMFQDITDRKRAEEALHQYAERLRIQHEIDTAILAARSPQEIARAVLKRLRSLVPFDRASITEIDLAGRQGRDIAFLAGGRQETTDGVWHSLSNAARVASTLQRGEAYLVQDIAVLEHPSPMERTLADSGVRSAISVPLISQDTLIGSLNLVAHDPGFFRPDHVDILEEIAASLAVALQQAHLLEQTREDAETKTLLLREVNHRVMNNLTAIIAILDMEQRRSLDDGVDFRAVLRDISSRIGGMVTVHRMLSSAHWQPLDLVTVFEQVIYAALGSSPIRHQIEVAVDTPDQPLRLASKQAISLALVVNELTTNCIKYAFHERSRGQIRVQIRALEEEKVQVVFRDNGPGMPDQVLAGEQRNVGLWLVESNVRHTLGGEIDYHNDDGAVVRFTFERAPLD